MTGPKIQVPLHLKPWDGSQEAIVRRFFHTQAMMALTGGRGFRVQSSRDSAIGQTRAQELALLSGFMKPPGPDEDWHSKRGRKKVAARRLLIERSARPGTVALTNWQRSQMHRRHLTAAQAALLQHPR